MSKNIIFICLFKKLFFLSVCFQRYYIPFILNTGYEYQIKNNKKVFYVVKNQKKIRRIKLRSCVWPISIFQLSSILRETVSSDSKNKIKEYSFSWNKVYGKIVIVRLMHIYYSNFSFQIGQLKSYINRARSSLFLFRFYLLVK